MTNEYGFTSIKPLELQENPFKIIGRDWFLMTAEKDGVANTMTVSWGGMGVMWGKNVVFAAVRPERHTFGFTEHADTFSLTTFDESWRKQLVYCGTVSGRDEDKITKAGLTLVHDGATPYFKEAQTAFICQKIMATVFQPEELLDQNFAKFYGGENTKDGLGGGWHTLYIAQIINLLVKQ